MSKVLYLCIFMSLVSAHCSAVGWGAPVSSDVMESGCVQKGGDSSGAAVIEDMFGLSFKMLLLGKSMATPILLQKYEMWQEQIRAQGIDQETICSYAHDLYSNYANCFQEKGVLSRRDVKVLEGLKLLAAQYDPCGLRALRGADDVAYPIRDRGKKAQSMPLTKMPQERTCDVFTYGLSFHEQLPEIIQDLKALEERRRLLDQYDLCGVSGLRGAGDMVYPTRDWNQSAQDMLWSEMPRDNAGDEFPYGFSLCDQLPKIMRDVHNEQVSYGNAKEAMEILFNSQSFAVCDASIVDNNVQHTNDICCKENKTIEGAEDGSSEASVLSILLVTEPKPTCSVKEVVQNDDEEVHLVSHAAVCASDVLQKGSFAKKGSQEQKDVDYFENNRVKLLGESQQVTGYMINTLLDVRKLIWLEGRYFVKKQSDSIRSKLDLFVKTTNLDLEETDTIHTFLDHVKIMMDSRLYHAHQNFSVGQMVLAVSFFKVFFDKVHARTTGRLSSEWCVRQCHKGFLSLALGWPFYHPERKKWCDEEAFLKAAEIFRYVPEARRSFAFIKEYYMSKQAIHFLLLKVRQHVYDSHGYDALHMDQHRISATEILPPPLVFTDMSVAKILGYLYRAMAEIKHLGMRKQEKDLWYFVREKARVLKSDSIGQIALLNFRAFHYNQSFEYLSFPEKIMQMILATSMHVKNAQELKEGFGEYIGEHICAPDDVLHFGYKDLIISDSVLYTINEHLKLWTRAEQPRLNDFRMLQGERFEDVFFDMIEDLPCPDMYEMLSRCVDTLSIRKEEVWTTFAAWYFLFKGVQLDQGKQLAIFMKQFKTKAGACIKMIEKVMSTPKILKQVVRDRAWQEIVGKQGEAAISSEGIWQFSPAAMSIMRIPARYYFNRKLVEALGGVDKTGQEFTMFEDENTSKLGENFSRRVDEKLAASCQRTKRQEDRKFFD